MTVLKHLKNILSLICVAVISVTVCLSAPLHTVANVSTTYTDTFSAWSEYVTKTGSWDLFPNHSDTGLSLAGRRSTSSENHIVYEFEGKEITGISLKVAEYSGFFDENDLVLSIYSDSKWSNLSLVRGNENNIVGATNNGFKSMNVSVSYLPENISKVKVTLNNAVAWTLFLDEITFDLTELENIPVEDTRTKFEDDFSSLNSPSDVIGSWSSFNPHIEFAASVFGRDTTTSENSVIYNFDDGKIDEIDVDIVVNKEFYSKNDIKVSVSADGVNYADVETTDTALKDIVGYESSSFKSATLFAKNIVGNNTYLKISLENAVNWTAFLDGLTVFGVSKLKEPVDDRERTTDNCTGEICYTNLLGDWNKFESHIEFGLSVYGRNTTDEETSVIYKYTSGNISQIDIGTVVYSGFFVNDDIEISVSQDGNSYSVVDFTKSVEADIANYETALFKSVIFSAKSIPDNSKYLKIKLKNAVNYTLFLDYVTAYGVSAVEKFDENTSGGGEDIQTEDKKYVEKKLSYTDCNGTSIDYYIDVPCNYDVNKKYPLLFFMHGVGGDTDTSGYDYLKEKVYESGYDFILLAPVANREKGQWWVDYGKLLSPVKAVYNQDELFETEAFVAAYNLLIDIENGYSVNNSQVYIMGVSMGGFATYEMITRYPKSFTAAVSICGGCDPAKADNIKNMPFWFFHGTNDITVSCNASKSLSVALKNLGGTKYKYSEYEGLDHGIWFKVFDEPDLFSWLISNKTPTAGKTIFLAGDDIAGAEIFTDSYENLEKTTLSTNGFDVFNPHPETGLSVIGRKNTGEKSIVYYTFNDKEIRKIACTLQFVEGLADLSKDISFEIAENDNSEWKKIPIRISKSMPINKTFMSKSVVSLSVPSGMHKLKITLSNEVLWALMLDELNLSLVNATNKMPEKSWTFIDNMIDGNKLSSYSNNLKFYTPHPETNLNVLSKKNAKKGYISYWFDGIVSDYEISLQIAPEFFEKTRDVLLQYRIKGSNDFIDAPFLCTGARKINGSFSLISLVPEKALPSGVEEIKINLYNDVAWTTMIESVKINATSSVILKKDNKGSEELKTDDENSDVKTEDKNNVKTSDNLLQKEDVISSENSTGLSAETIIIICAVCAVIVGGVAITIIIIKSKFKAKR